MTTAVDIIPEAVEKMAFFLEFGGFYPPCTPVDMLRALRSALTARDRQLEVANKLWQLCVKEDFPWADGSTQDSLTELGLLYPKDMTDEDPSERCKNCDDDCETCWRAVDKLEDLE